MIWVSFQGLCEVLESGCVPFRLEKQPPLGMSFLFWLSTFKLYLLGPISRTSSQSLNFLLLIPPQLSHPTVNYLIKERYSNTATFRNPITTKTDGIWASKSHREPQRNALLELQRQSDPDPEGWGIRDNWVTRTTFWTTPSRYCGTSTEGRMA